MVDDKDVYKMVHAIVRFTSKVRNSKEYDLLRKYVSNYSKGEYNKSFGKIWVHDKKTQKIQYISRDEFDGSIYIKGLPYQRGGFKDYKWINNKINEAMIPKDDAIPKGWYLGRLVVPDNNHMKLMASNRHTKEKDLEHSKKMSGENHFNYGKESFNKGKKWINNGIKSKMVKIDELKTFIDNGWKLGRL
jgi:hypothetical protein